MYFKKITLRGERLVSFLKLHIEDAASVNKEELISGKDVRKKKTDKNVEEILDIINHSKHVYCTDMNHEICLIVSENHTDYFLYIRDLEWDDPANTKK